MSTGSLTQDMEGLIKYGEENFSIATAFIRKMIVDSNGAYDDLVSEETLNAMRGWKSFHGNPYVVDSNAKGCNFVALIKWYRGEHGADLKSAKEICEEYIVQKYPDSEFAGRFTNRHYGE